MILFLQLPLKSLCLHDWCSTLSSLSMLPLDNFISSCGYTVFCRVEMLPSPAPVLKSLLETRGLELGSMKAGQVRMVRPVEQQLMGSCEGQGLRAEVADASQGPARGAAQGRRDPFLGKQGLSFPRRPENHTSCTKNLEGGKTQWREVGEDVAGLGNDAALAGTQEICTT